MTVIIGRPIKGISINGLEYLLDDKNNPMKFKSEEKARSFLKKNGFTAAEISSFTYELEEKEQCVPQI